MRDVPLCSMYLQFSALHVCKPLLCNVLQACMSCQACQQVTALYVCKSLYILFCDHASCVKSRAGTFLTCMCACPFYALLRKHACAAVPSVPAKYLNRMCASPFYVLFLLARMLSHCAKLACRLVVPKDVQFAACQPVCMVSHYGNNFFHLYHASHPRVGGRFCNFCATVPNALVPSVSNHSRNLTTISASLLVWANRQFVFANVVPMFQSCQQSCGVHRCKPSYTGGVLTSRLHCCILCQYFDMQAFLFWRKDLRSCATVTMAHRPGANVGCSDILMSFQWQGMARMAQWHSTNVGCSAIFSSF